MTVEKQKSGYKPRFNVYGFYLYVAMVAADGQDDAKEVPRMLKNKEENMKVVVAIDSLKGSLSSVEAGNCIRAGILKAVPDADVLVSPMADGGEGTVEALISGMGGTLQRVSVSGPLGDPVTCEYGILEDGKTAVIEMAWAAGITLVPAAQRNPFMVWSMVSQ